MRKHGRPFRFAMALGICFLLIFLDVSEGTEQSSTAMGEIATEICLKNLADGSNQNLIVSSKAAIGMISVGLGKLPFKEGFAKIAESANISFIESAGMFVFSSKENLDSMSSVPELKGSNASDPITLDFLSADIRGVVEIISRKTGCNIVISKEVRGSVTVRIKDLPWQTVLHHIVTSSGYAIRSHGNTIIVADPKMIDNIIDFPLSPENPGESIDIAFRDTDIRDVLKSVASHYNRCFVSERNVRGNVNIDLKDVCENDAMNVIARSQGFAAERIGDVWIIIDGRKTSRLKEEIRASGVISSTDGVDTRNAPGWRAFSGMPFEDRISMDFRDTDIRIIFSLIGKKTNRRVRLVKSIRGNVTIRFQDMSVSDVLAILAATHGFSVRYENDAIEVFDKIGPSDFEEISPQLAGQRLSQPPVQIPDRPIPSKAAHLAMKPLLIRGIVGNQTQRAAIIIYENKFYLVKKDMVIDGCFKIVDILSNKVVVYSMAEQMRRMFYLGMGK